MPPVPDLDKESDSPIHHFINNYHNIVNLYGIPLFFLSSQVTYLDADSYSHSYCLYPGSRLSEVLQHLSILISSPTCSRNRASNHTFLFPTLQTRPFVTPRALRWVGSTSDNELQRRATESVPTDDIQVVESQLTVDMEKTLSTQF